MQGLGVTRDSDLFEVGGCLVRLAMWPTERLWEHVEEAVAGELLASCVEIDFHRNSVIIYKI
jgi:hypothetical protein